MEVSWGKRTNSKLGRVRSRSEGLGVGSTPVTPAACSCTPQPSHPQNTAVQLMRGGPRLSTLLPASLGPQKRGSLLGKCSLGRACCTLYLLAVAPFGLACCIPS